MSDTPLIPGSPADRLAQGNARIAELCEHCRSGQPVSWQEHSREWVHRRSVLAGKGGQFSITLCGADGFRKGETH